MATSGSVNFVVTRDQIIEDAYNILGVLEEGEQLTNSRLTYAARQLNLFIKSLSNRGGFLWTTKEAELPLVDGIPDYTLGPSGDLNMHRPVRILSARYTDSSDIETPLSVMSRQEYFDQSNKESEGIPNQYYYDRQLTLGTLYLWPTPNNSTDSIKFTYEDFIEDFDSASNDTAFPPEWQLALSWQLAALLAFREDVDMNKVQLITQKAEFLLDEATGFDQENTSVYFEVEGDQ